MKTIICLVLAITMTFTLCACDPQQTRENTKQILKDVFIALPGGLKEAQETVIEPAIETAKDDIKEIYDAAKPSWEEAFPGLAGDQSTENTETPEQEAPAE